MKPNKIMEIISDIKERLTVQADLLNTKVCYLTKLELAQEQRKLNETIYKRRIRRIFM